MFRLLFRVSIQLGAAAVVLTGCSDSTAPERQPRLKLTLERLEPPVQSAAFDEPRISCAANIRASVLGTGTLQWGNATFSYFVGRDRTTATEHIEIPAAQVQEWWTRPDIRPRDTLTVRLQFEASIPFGAVMEFRFTEAAGGETQSASVRFDCGPVVEANTPAPSITHLTVTPGTGAIEPGQVVRVSYRVEARAPLWLTTVQLLGTCNERRNFTEGGAATVAERTVEISVPAACTAAAPLTVRVHAMDVGAAQVSRLGATLNVVDSTPPTLSRVGFHSVTSGSPHGGDFFTGDSLRLQFSARDNQGIATLVWDVLPHGHRDSVRIDSYEAYERRVAVPVRPEWVGTVQLRLYVRDPSGLTSEPVTTAPDSVRIHPTVARPTRFTRAGVWTHEAIWDEASGRIYALQASPNRIAVLSASDFQLLRTIPLPQQPMDFDLSPNGDTLVVLVWYRTEVGVLDLTRTESTITWRPIVGAHMLMKVLALRGGRAFVSANFQNAPSWRLMDMELATGAVRTRTEVDAAVLSALQWGRSPDNRVHVFNGSRMQRYDAARDEFSPVADRGPLNGVPSLDATGQRVAIGRALYDGALQPLRRLTFDPGRHPPTVISPDATTIWHAFDPPYGLVQARAADGGFVDRTLLPAWVDRLQISADGSTLFATNRDTLAFIRVR